MTTELDRTPTTTRRETLAPDVVSQIADNAADLDEGDRDTRDNVGLLARSGLLHWELLGITTTPCLQWPR